MDSERSKFRLECLKLRNRFDRSCAEVITEAKILEEYLFGQDLDSKRDVSEHKAGAKVKFVIPSSPNKDR